MMSRIRCSSPRMARSSRIRSSTSACSCLSLSASSAVSRWRRRSRIACAWIRVRSNFSISPSRATSGSCEPRINAITASMSVIALIRGSQDPDVARDGLMEKFDLTRIQAQAILDLRLQRLTALEADKLKQEHADVLERIRELRAILGDEQRIRDIIKEELTEIRDAYGDERRTDITHSEDDIDIEDLIADQQMVISITKSGYIK